MCPQRGCTSPPMALKALQVYAHRPRADGASTWMGRLYLAKARQERPRDEKAGAHLFGQLCRDVGARDARRLDAHQVGAFETHSNAQMLQHLDHGADIFDIGYILDEAFIPGEQRRGDDGQSRVFSRHKWPLGLREDASPRSRSAYNYLRYLKPIGSTACKSILLYAWHACPTYIMGRIAIRHYMTGLATVDPICYPMLQSRTPQAGPGHLEAYTRACKRLPGGCKLGMIAVLSHHLYRPLTSSLSARHINLGGAFGGVGQDDDLVSTHLGQATADGQALGAFAPVGYSSLRVRATPRAGRDAAEWPIAPEDRGQREMISASIIHEPIACDNNYIDRRRYRGLGFPLFCPKVLELILGHRAASPPLASHLLTCLAYKTLARAQCLARH